MATAAQIAANRANAQLSTGPKTAEGKARSSRNNLKYGLTSREFVVLPGQEQTIKDWITGLLNEIHPCGDLELDLFRQLAHASWALHRCRQAEVQSFNSRSHSSYDILAYPVNPEALKLIDLYARRAERSYHRALKELKTLQTERLLRDEWNPAPAPLADPRIVRQQEQPAVEEKTIAASACGTGETAAAASESTASEKSNPIPAGQASSSMKVAMMPQPAGSPLGNEAAASESSNSEKSNPIPAGRGSALSGAAA